MGGLWHDWAMTISFRRRRWVGMTAAALALGLMANVPAGTEPQSALPPAGNQALWNPERKVVGFRNIARLYGGDVIHHGTTVMPLPRAAQELDVHYQVAGASWDAAKFMEHNRV